MVRQYVRLMSVSDVAAYLGKGRKWVYQHAAELGGVRVGRDIRFPKGEIDVWLEKHRLGPRRRRKA
jgi:excisionase family DNA binding protein